MAKIGDVLHDVLGFSTLTIEEVIEDIVKSSGTSDSLELLRQLQAALPLDEDDAIHLVVKLQELDTPDDDSKRRRLEDGSSSSTNRVDNKSLSFADASIQAAMGRNIELKDDPLYIERLREESRREYLREREKMQLTLAKRLAEDREQWDVNNAKLREKNLDIRDLEMKKIQLAEEIQRQREQSVQSAMTTYTMPISAETTVEKLGVLKARIRGGPAESEKAKRPMEEWEKDKLRANLVPIAAEETTRFVDDDGNEVIFERAAVEKVGSNAEAQDDWWHLSLREREELKRQEIKTKRDRIMAGRKSLPVYRFRKQILKAIKDNPVIILVGETGSGKTTQIPQFLNEVGYGDLGVIACSQPRRVAAMSVATRVAEEMGVKLGHEVGYIIRFESEVTGNDGVPGMLPTNVTVRKNSAEDKLLPKDRRTRICYMTDGVLLNHFMVDPLLSSFSCVMIDEAHERSINTDVLFALIKDLSRFRPDDLRVIISSATMESEKLSQYFDDAPIFTVPGRKHPVEIMYTKQPEANFIHAAALTVMQIHLNEPLYEEKIVNGELVKEHSGDILAFLPGQQEIEECMELIQEMDAQHREKQSRRIPELRTLPIYSSMPSDQQALIFQPTPIGSRKCILATNIAETSITIDNIVYVIDPGLVKQNLFNPRTGLQSLLTVPCSRASCNQRAGRAGRVKPGKCYRLFTMLSWEKELEENNTPEILRSDITQIVLLLKSLGIDDLINFDFIDPPPSQALIRSLELLYHLGALNDHGSLTEIGRSMASLPSRPSVARMILAAGLEYKCLEDILIIAAMLEVGHGIFYTPSKEKAQLAENARKQFLRSDGDHFTLLNVYRSWESMDYDQHWCYEHFVQFRLLKRAKDIFNQLAGLLPRVGLDVDIDDEGSSDNVIPIKKAISKGFFMQIALLSQNGQYKTVADNRMVDIHPHSALFSTEKEDVFNFNRKFVRPNCVLYTELVQTTKEYMRNCITVDPQLLTEVAPHFFKSKKLGGDAKFNT